MTRISFLFRKNLQWKNRLLGIQPIYTIFITISFRLNWAGGALTDQYFQAASNAQIAGRAIGYLMNQLKNKGMNVQFHCVGHSLGSHVCAYAGYYTQSEFGWKIDRITGLDPAGPNFERSDVAVRIDKSDAEFVDIIHTNTGPTGAGITAPLGHADFYPNGGHKVCYF